VFEAVEEAPEADAERRKDISDFLGLVSVFISWSHITMSWQPSLCSMSISLKMSFAEF
jgi:hypothetical protein